MNILATEIFFSCCFKCEQRLMLCRAESKNNVNASERASESLVDPKWRNV